MAVARALLPLLTPRAAATTAATAATCCHCSYLRRHFLTPQLPPEPTIIRRHHSLALQLGHYGLGDARTATLAAAARALPHVDEVDLRDCRLTQLNVTDTLGALAQVCARAVCRMAAVA